MYIIQKSIKFKIERLFFRQTIIKGLPYKVIYKGLYIHGAAKDRIRLFTRQTIAHF